MKHLLNTLYIKTRECKLSLDNEGILVQKPDKTKVRVVGRDIDSIVCFGNTSITTPLVRYCTENGITITFLSESGSLYGTIQGKPAGNVTLRYEQYRHLQQQTKTRQQIVKGILDAKLHNSRIVLLQAARNANDDRKQALQDASAGIEKVRRSIKETSDIDSLRGYEGTAANLYFDAFPSMIKSADPDLQFSGRSRRPPKDPVNTLISFLYTLLAKEAEGALLSVGYDPACGYMHTLRSGKPAMALDLMEEFRAPICDRIALDLINRKQISGHDFVRSPDGSIVVQEDARNKLLGLWHSKKQESIFHPVLNEKVPLGLLPYAQAMLLARVIRGDNVSYIGMHWR